VGITKFAVDQLTDVVYIELPDVGDHVFAGEDFGEIESVKSVNDLYSPCDGEVIAVNKKLEDDPTIINKDPYGEGWMIKIKVEPGTKLDKMLSQADYEKQIASQGH
jgi:glycine cleavage system H protein